MGPGSLCAGTGYQGIRASCWCVKAARRRCSPTPVPVDAESLGSARLFVPYSSPLHCSLCTDFLAPPSSGTYSFTSVSIFSHQMVHCPHWASSESDPNQIDHFPWLHFSILGLHFQEWPIDNLFCGCLSHDGVTFFTCSPVNWLLCWCSTSSSNG